MADETADAPQRWTAKRRVALAPAAARKHGLTVVEIEEWRQRFLLGAENALRARPKDEDALKDEVGGGLCEPAKARRLQPSEAISDPGRARAASSSCSSRSLPSRAMWWRSDPRRG